MRACAALMCVFVTILSVIVAAEPTIGIYTDSDCYEPGETIEVSLSARNPGAEQAVDVYDCCIEDDDDGEGNIHDDPEFVIGPLGEYYLHPDSPCIDAGSQSAEQAGLSDRTTQVDSTPDTGQVDMGFHYPIE